MTGLVEVKRLGEVLDLINDYYDRDNLATFRTCLHGGAVLLVIKRAVFWQPGETKRSPHAYSTQPLARPQKEKNL